MHMQDKQGPTHTASPDEPCRLDAIRKMYSAYCRRAEMDGEFWNKLR